MRAFTSPVFLFLFLVTKFKSERKISLDTQPNLIVYDRSSKKSRSQVLCFISDRYEVAKRKVSGILNG